MEEKIMIISFQYGTGQVTYSFSESALHLWQTKTLLITWYADSISGRAIKQIICNLFLCGAQRQILFLSFESFLSSREAASEPAKVPHAFKCKFSGYLGMRKPVAQEMTGFEVYIFSHSSQEKKPCHSTHMATWERACQETEQGGNMRKILLWFSQKGWARKNKQV